MAHPVIHFHDVVMNFALALAIGGLSGIAIYAAVALLQPIAVRVRRNRK